MSNRYPMTVRGEALLRDELTDLKSVQLFRSVSSSRRSASPRTVIG